MAKGYDHDYDEFSIEKVQCLIGQLNELLEALEDDTGKTLGLKQKIKNTIKLCELIINADGVPTLKYLSIANASFIMIERIFNEIRDQIRDINNKIESPNEADWTRKINEWDQARDTLPEYIKEVSEIDQEPEQERTLISKLERLLQQTIEEPLIPQDYLVRLEILELLKRYIIIAREGAGEWLDCRPWTKTLWMKYLMKAVLNEDDEGEWDQNPIEAFLNEDDEEQWDQSPIEALLNEDDEGEWDQNPIEALLNEDDEEEVDQNRIEALLKALLNEDDEEQWDQNPIEAFLNEDDEEEWDQNPIELVQCLEEMEGKIDEIILAFQSIDLFSQSYDALKAEACILFSEIAEYKEDCELNQILVTATTMPSVSQHNIVFVESEEEDDDEEIEIIPSQESNATMVQQEESLVVLMRGANPNHPGMVDL